MNYQESLFFIESLGESRMRFDLERSEEFRKWLGEPDMRLTSIIIGGTNGKGSTTHFLSNVFLEGHYSVGVYTSPHVESIRERIQIDGQWISEKDFARTASIVRLVLEKRTKEKPTYFEFLTMMAVVFFSEMRVDLAIFEVGLGGRLDTTNVLKRAGTILTKIDLDHCDILGESLEAIAREKLEIMRPLTPCVLQQQASSVFPIIDHEAHMRNTPLIAEGRDYLISENEDFEFQMRNQKWGPFRLRLHGFHQRHNAGAALAMALQLRDRGLVLEADAIGRGLENAWLPGRLEGFLLKNGKEVILDVAHSPGAVVETFNYCQRNFPQKMDVLFGCLQNKDAEEMIRILQPLAKRFLFTEPASSRAKSAFSLREIPPHDVEVHVIPKPKDAFEMTYESTDPLLVVGSFYLVSEIRPLILDLRESFY